MHGVPRNFVVENERTLPSNCFYTFNDDAAFLCCCISSVYILLQQMTANVLQSVFGGRYNHFVHLSDSVKDDIVPLTRIVQ